MPLRVWTCNDHDTLWPVGGASVVVAATAAEARALLIEALRKRGISQSEEGFSLVELEMYPHAVVLCDGDY